MNTISPTERITVCTSNLMNDVDHPQSGYPSQHDRIVGLVDLINQTRTGSGVFVHFLNELVDEQALDAIARETDARVVGEPAEYSRDASYMAFVADHETAVVSETEFVATPSEEGDNGFMRMQVGRAAFYGFHPPYKPFGADRDVRNAVFDEVYEQAINDDYAFLVGDSNMPPFYPARRRFTRVGFEEAHVQDRPMYPSFAEFRGKTCRPWTPRTNLDFIMARSKSLDVQLLAAGHEKSLASDHPTLRADYRIPAVVFRAT